MDELMDAENQNSEPLEIKPSHPNAGSFRQRRHLLNRRWVWFFGGVVTFFILSLVVIGGIYASITLSKLPREMAQSLYHSPWVELNAHALEMDSPKAFDSLHQKLNVQHQAHPNDPIPLLLLGHKAQVLGHYNQARDHYLSALQIIQSSAWFQYLYGAIHDEVLANLSLIHYYQGHLEKAKQTASGIQNLDDLEDAPLMTALAQRLYAPERGDFHFALGVQLRHQLQLPLAKAELEKAQQLTFDPATRVEIDHYLKHKMPKTTEDIHPLTRYYLLAGSMQESLYKNYPKAQQFYQKATEQQPHFEWAHSQLAIVQYRQKNYNAALQQSYEAIALNPNYVSPYLTLGDVEIDRANYTLAIAHYMKALALTEASPLEEQRALRANIQNQIGFAYEQLGVRQQARYAYQQAEALAHEFSDDATYAQHALKRV